MATDVQTRPASPPDRPAPPAMTPVELARWAWRQLTSMRTALILLFLLALAAVPGSVVPQEAVDAVRASQWREDHPTLAPIYDRLGLFSVYESPWFSAIYLLLMISLVGCIVPRLAVYWRGLRARPPAAPRRLTRLPEHRELHPDGGLDPDAALETARAWLRRRRYRVVVDEESGTVSAERGYLREAGNLLFHLSVLVVLVGFALGGLFGFRGGAIVVTGDGFANTTSQFDEFRPGVFFTPDDLRPFDFTVDDFDVQFIREGREAGMAREFEADVTYRDSPGAPERRARVAVNHPLSIDGTDVFLIGHGYAPVITVRNADGTRAWSGPVPFLPEDSTFRSFGVVKVPDAEQADGGTTQLGFEGEFYPTYGFTKASGPFSAFPDARNPAISVLAYAGDLGMDGGVPQSVFALRKSGLRPIENAEGRPLRIDLPLGGSETLPNGLGTISFDGVQRYVKLQVSDTPGQLVALGGVVLGLVGLLGSLFIRPRRVWVRVRPAGGPDDEEPGRRLVEVAGLDRSSGGDLSGEVDALVAALDPTGPRSTPTPEEKP